MKRYIVWRIVPDTEAEVTPSNSHLEGVGSDDTDGRFSAEALAGAGDKGFLNQPENEGQTFRVVTLAIGEKIAS